jgi:dTDP-D-glucose 4,6-dehydratase
MKILAAGGAGFIGSAFDRLVMASTGWRIVNPRKLTYAGKLPAARATASFRAISAALAGALAELGKSRPGRVALAAAIAC